MHAGKVLNRNSMYGMSVKSSSLWLADKFHLISSEKNKTIWMMWILIEVGCTVKIIGGVVRTKENGGCVL